MDYHVTREQVWFAPISDQIGRLAEMLRALSAGGVELEFVIARRDTPGRVLVFISPLRTPAEIETAQQSGFYVADGLHALRIEGPDRTGFGAQVTTALAEADIYIRGFSAAALGDRQVTNIAFDSAEDADTAKGVLERVLSSDAGH